MSDLCAINEMNLLRQTVSGLDKQVAALERENAELRKSLTRLATFVEKNPPLRGDSYGNLDCGCAALAQDGRHCEYHTEASIARAALAAREKEGSE